MSDPNENGYWIGFDLGGTKMLAVLYDGQFRPVGRKRKRTKGHEGADKGIARITRIVRTVLEEAEVPIEQVRGIGIGCPGPIDMDRGLIVDAVNLGWKDVPLKSLLETEFKRPVVVANDVDAGVYGENLFGAARSARSVLGVFPGTGIGGGFVYDGEIFRGNRLSCMEIGHVQVVPDGRLCGCGRLGCLEAEASRLAIASAAAKAAFRGEAPYLMKAVGTDLASIRSGILAEAIRAGDLVVEQIVERAAGHIGRLVGNVANLLAPEVVVLGGGLVEAMPELFVRAVEQEARRSAMSTYADVFRVVAAELGDDANVLGAAAWAAKQVAGRVDVALPV